MKLASILAFLGIITIFGSLIFIGGFLLSSEANGSDIFYALLVMLNGFIALGISDISVKLQKKA
ncbi:hypothetical protein [Sutcliffiella horikoshii]|uniref:hypothetical protein n=1 Tax=Sutcliffiella horikoshii TaxID=79883 RepID=UPI001CFE9A54|nr:hypothetical protein [Sutcliffiella horikoshii]